MMHVAFLTHQYFPRHVGGTEVYTHLLANYARNAGHRATIYTYVESPSGDPSEFGITETEHDDIQVFELGYNLSVAPHPARFEYDHAIIQEVLTEHLAAHRPDIVHATHLMKLSGSAARAVRNLHIPFILTLTDFWAICGRHTLLRWNGRLCEGPTHRLDCVRCFQHTHQFARLEIPRPLVKPRQIRSFPNRTVRFFQDLRAISKRNASLKDALSLANYIIALSQFQRAMLIRNGIPGEWLEVIPHGINPSDLIAPLARKQGPIRVGFIGSIAPHKGLHILLEALALIPQAEIKLAVYGELQEDNSYANDLLRRSERDPRIEWKGTFPPGKFAEVLTRLDALLVPAQWYENAPYVIQAALQMGVPVIASRIGSLTEMIEGHEGHLLLDPGDVRSWSAALLQLSVQGRKGPLPRVGFPSMDDHAERVFQVYRECLAHEQAS